MKEEKMSSKSSHLISSSSSSSNQNAGTVAAVASAPAAIVGLSQMEGAINQLLQRFDQQERERLEAQHRQNVEQQQRNGDFLRSVTQIIFQAVATGGSSGGGTASTAAIELPGSGGRSSLPPLPPSSTSQAAASAAAAASSRTTQIINLRANQSHADEPFQETISARGAIKILNLDCTEDGCNWRGMVDQLAAHLQQVHRIWEHRCMVYSCTKSFKDLPNLKKHFLLHHRSDQLRCRSCNQLYQGYIKLKDHYQRCHKLGYYQCAFGSCSKVFKTKSLAYSHRNGCPHRFSSTGSTSTNEMQRPNTRSASSATTTTTMPPNHSTASAFSAVARSGGNGLGILAGTSTSRNSGTTAKPSSLVTSSTSRLG